MRKPSSGSNPWTSRRSHISWLILSITSLPDGLYENLPSGTTPRSSGEVRTLLITQCHPDLVLNRHHEVGGHGQEGQNPFPKKPPVERVPKPMVRLRRGVAAGFPQNPGAWKTIAGGFTWCLKTLAYFNFF